VEEIAHLSDFIPHADDLLALCPLASALRLMVTSSWKPDFNWARAASSVVRSLAEIGAGGRAAVIRRHRHAGSNFVTPTSAFPLPSTGAGGLSGFPRIGAISGWKVKQRDVA
jgi:hypothetical protein